MDLRQHFTRAPRANSRRKSRSRLSASIPRAGVDSGGSRRGNIDFRMGGLWDAQRAGGRFYPEYRDFANVAIGLYAGAAGLTADQINVFANVYARAAGSRYRDTMDALPSLSGD
jgi:hypothetical protein